MVLRDCSWVDCARSQAPVVQTLDSTIHRIKIYPVDNAIGFSNTYLLNSDLSGGQRYPRLEQLGPGLKGKRDEKELNMTGWVVCALTLHQWLG